MSSPNFSVAQMWGPATSSGDEGIAWSGASEAAASKGFTYFHREYFSSVQFSPSAGWPSEAESDNLDASTVWGVHPVLYSVPVDASGYQAPNSEPWEGSTKPKGNVPTEIPVDLRLRFRRSKEIQSVDPSFKFCKHKEAPTNDLSFNFSKNAGVPVDQSFPYSESKDPNFTFWPLTPTTGAPKIKMPAVIPGSTLMSPSERAESTEFPLTVDHVLVIASGQLWLKPTTSMQASDHGWPRESSLKVYPGANKRRMGCR